MTTRSTGDAEQPAYADAAALVGLAQEVEALRRATAGLASLPDQVNALARMVEGLTETTAAAPRRPGGNGAPSWLDAGTEHADTAAVLADLVAWLGQVYLRYADAAASLPECWLWHPDVTEELLWLQHAWHHAYRSDQATVARAGDWHDRQRPGVVRRIRAAAGTCSLESHQPGGDRHGGAAPVPLAEALGLIATWWAYHRDTPPEPDAAHAAAAAALRAPRGRR